MHDAFPDKLVGHMNDKLTKHKDHLTSLYPTDYMDWAINRPRPEDMVLSRILRNAAHKHINPALEALAGEIAKCETNQAVDCEGNEALAAGLIEARELHKRARVTVYIACSALLNMILVKAKKEVGIRLRTSASNTLLATEEMAMLERALAPAAR